MATELVAERPERVGEHLPGALGRRGDTGHTRLSTHDVAGKGRWTLFTGIGGEDWAVAAQRLIDSVAPPWSATESMTVSAMVSMR